MLPTYKIEIDIQNCFESLQKYSRGETVDITSNGMIRIKKFIVDYLGDEYLDQAKLRVYLNAGEDPRLSIENALKSKLSESLQRITQMKSGQPYLSPILEEITFKVELFPDKANDHNYGSFSFKGNESTICIRNPDDDVSILHEIIHAACYAKAVKLKTKIGESDQMDDLLEEFILFLKVLLLNYKEKLEETTKILETYILGIDKNLNEYIKENITPEESNKIIKIMNLELSVYDQHKKEKAALNAHELENYSIIKLQNTIKLHIESVKNKDLYKEQSNKAEMTEELLCRAAEIHYEIKNKIELARVKSIIPNNLPVRQIINDDNLANLININEIRHDII